MAKLISLNNISGEVATIAGPITFVDGVAEVDDAIAAQIQVSDIRVEVEEPKAKEPQKEEAPAPKAPVKKAPAKK